MTSEAYSAGRLTELLGFASANAVARPAAVYLMPSDIVWRGPTAEDVRFWYDDDGLAGYTWFEPSTGFEMDLRHDLEWGSEVAAAMMECAEARRLELPEAYPWLVDLQSMGEWEHEVLHPRGPGAGDGRWLTSVAFESDLERVRALEGREYKSTGHFGPDYRLDLRAELAAVELPAGMRVRSVRDDETELAERVATHRDAWVGSSWTIERYREIRESPAYDPDLDLVVDVGDGTFANCCICWADPASGIGSFEPVGTRPAWRGKGVTRALILEGLGRLKAKSMHAARVGTAGFNTPAQALYEACGFERVHTLRTFMRRLD